MTTTEIITNWELSLNDYQTNKLLHSKLDAIQCYNIDKQEKEENLREQAWDIETYKKLFYSEQDLEPLHYKDSAFDYLDSRDGDDNR